MGFGRLSEPPKSLPAKVAKEEVTPVKKEVAKPEVTPVKHAAHVIDVEKRQRPTTAQITTAVWSALDRDDKN